MHKTGGVNHFFVATTFNSTSAGAPVEFTEPGIYNESGVCVSGTCPGSDYATAARISSSDVVANWGENADGSAHDAFGGLKDKWWNLATGDLDSGCGDSDGCYSQWGVVTPNGDWLVSYSATYGNHSIVSEDDGTLSAGGHVIGSILVHLISSNNGGNRSTAAYGPFTFKDSGDAVPPVSGYGGSSGTTFRAVGTYSARWFTVMPDGSLGWGSGDPGETQYYGAQGPGLQVSPASAWPTTTTTTSATTRIVADKSWLHYWDLDGFFNPAVGSLAGDQPNWAFRMPGFPYAWEADGVHAYQGVPTAIDPGKNGGVGTWSDYDRVNGAIYIDTTSKAGLIEFLLTSTNHVFAANSGNYNDCSNAHRYYDAAAGNICPVHGCDVGGSNTGPVTNYSEPRWVFYSASDLSAVRSKSKTDYSVDPVDTLFPGDLTGIGIGGAYQIVSKQAVPIGYDKDTNNLYVSFEGVDHQGCCDYNPVIGVFHVAQ
jgi:hypothetical protein